MNLNVVDGLKVRNLLNKVINGNQFNIAIVKAGRFPVNAPGTAQPISTFTQARRSSSTSSGAYVVI
jgi:hypothetical protein